MPRLVVGLWPGILLCFVTGCPQPDPATCGGFCGQGTECVNAKCVVVVADEVAEDEPVDDGKGRKRRRRGRRTGAGPDGEPLADFKAVDDSQVPRYDDNRGSTITDDQGTERLSNRKVQQHMGGLEDKFNQCIATAAEHSPDEIGNGQVSFDINVEPDGRVTGVSAQAPKHLRVFGIVPCLRVAIHRSRFPTWDGPPMRVEYSFTVG